MPPCQFLGDRQGFFMGRIVVVQRRPVWIRVPVALMNREVVYRHASDDRCSLRFCPSHKQHVCLKIASKDVGPANKETLH
jgi:hypothetical protein